jgi:ABC-type molybdate transport system permease subunit
MTNQPDKTNRALRIKNLALAGMAGQVGCLTLVIVLGAVFLGLWLDSTLGTRPWFTLGLVVASIPVSLLVMLAVARTAISKIKASTVEEK